MFPMFRCGEKGCIEQGEPTVNGSRMPHESLTDVLFFYSPIDAFFCLIFLTE